MMLSHRSLSAEVMNLFTPVMFQVPSSLSVALARPAPTSEPASGSVSTMLVFQPRSMMIWAMRLSRSLPLRWTMPAKAGPAPYIQMGALAPSTISPRAQTRLEGAGVPPSSSGSWRRQYSASCQAW